MQGWNKPLYNKIIKKIRRWFYFLILKKVKETNPEFKMLMPKRKYFYKNDFELPFLTPSPLKKIPKYYYLF